MVHSYYCDKIKGLIQKLIQKITYHFVSGYLCWSQCRTLYFIVIIQMAHFFETLTRGDPFVRENGRRIKITGWCVIVGGLFHFFWKLGSYLYFEKIVVANGASLPGVRYLLRELHPVVILAGMIILVIAGIFQKGALLKEEQELTI